MSLPKRIVVCGARQPADARASNPRIYEFGIRPILVNCNTEWTFIRARLTCLRIQISTTFQTDTSIIMASAKAFDFAGEVAIVTGAGSRMSGTFHLALKCLVATV